MVRICPWLYVGKYRDTANPALLSSYDIGAMLQLAEHVPQPGIVSLYLAVEDGQPIPDDKLTQGIEFVRAQKAAGKKILVACGAGISRSVTYAIATLKEEEGLSLSQAYMQILTMHPEALPHPALWESLRAHYGDSVTYDEMWEEILKLRRNAK